MRLADGRYQCPACKQGHGREAMHSKLVYCRPCFRSKAREAYALRQALQRANIAPRPRRLQPPENFAATAPGRSDDVLAGMYGVGTSTIRRWRNWSGIPSNKLAMPTDFARLCEGMTGPQIAAKWSVSTATAYAWLRRVGRSRRDRARPVPADRAEMCARKGMTDIARHYDIPYKQAGRWARESGIAPRKPGAATRVVAEAAPHPRPEQPSARPVAPVQVHTNGCRDCTLQRLCRAHQTAQLNADIEAWLAAGNAPREVPQGASGLQFGWTRPAQ